MYYLKLSGKVLQVLCCCAERGQGKVGEVGMEGGEREEMVGEIVGERVEATEEEKRGEVELGFWAEFCRVEYAKYQD